MEDIKKRRRKKKPEDLELELKAMIQYMKEDPIYQAVIRHLERALVNLEIEHRRIPQWTAIQN